MKNFTRAVALLFILQITTNDIWSQRGDIQFFRPYDQRGVNVIETSKNDSTPFDGLKLRIGANFTQGFQSLSHSNTSGVAMYELASGFPLAQANLNIDVQLEDGIHLNVVSYMASHHHNEMWVKGGFVQIDKVSFLKSDVMNKIWKNLTLKVGHMEINYGDAHFSRSDGGNTFWNPFVENNILDAFATEIGAELYWQKKGFIVMGGMTNGEIQGNITKIKDRAPSVYAKVGYDKPFGIRNRIRLTASLLSKSSSINGTLYGGDRTGSNYQFVMEPAVATVAANAFSGRVNPNLKDNVTALMINPFIKFGAVEFLGTYEIASGKNQVESGEIKYTPAAADIEVFKKLNDRQFTQIAAQLILRFGPREQFYVGAKYNTLQGVQVFGQTTNVLEAGGINQGTRVPISVERTTFAAGWYVTRNILMKGEYVMQSYKDYPATHILAGGKFSGFVLQGSIAF